MNNKYLFKIENDENSFATKNEFIDYCQARYNDCLRSGRKYNFYFSYDSGRTWYHISDFKELRQTIQNERRQSLLKFKDPATKKSDGGVASDRGVSNNSNGKAVLFNYFAYGFAIWVGLTILNKEVKMIGFINKINGNVFGWDSKFVRNDGSREKMENNASEEDVLIEASDQDNEFLRNVQVTDYAREIYANSFLNEVNVTAEEKKWILGILSDPNPDPSGEAGNNCYTQSFRCKYKYCSNFIPSRLYTLQSILEDMVGPFSSYNLAMKFLSRKFKGDNTQIQSEPKETEAVEIDEPNDVLRALNNIDWEGAFNDATTNELNKGFDTIKSIIFMYKNNVRVECINTPIDEEFCSEKCSMGYKYSR